MEEKMKNNNHSEITQEMLQLIIKFSRVKWSQRPCPDLKPSECELLGVLYLSTIEDANQSTSPSTLSEELSITPAGVTHLINALEDGGYIQRNKDPEDRRVVLISLTQKGVRSAENLIHDAYQKLNGLVEHLGKQDSQTFNRIMSAALNYFEKNPISDKQ